jgi:hypothetical protein
MNRWSCIAVALAALGGFGCSDDSTTALGGGIDGGFGDSASSDASDANALVDGASDGAPAEGGNDAGDKGCKNETTKAACTACCAANHTAGVATLNNAIASCGCEQANCATQCAATLCAANPMEPDQPCTNCLTPKVAMGGACYQPVLTACEADPDCVAYFGCTGTNGASCSTKP